MIIVVKLLKRRLVGDVGARDMILIRRRGTRMRKAGWLGADSGDGWHPLTQSRQQLRARAALHRCSRTMKHWADNVVASEGGPGRRANAYLLLRAPLWLNSG